MFVADGLRHEVLCLENGEVREQAFALELPHVHERTSTGNLPPRDRLELQGKWKPPKTNWKTERLHKRNDHDAINDEIFQVEDNEPTTELLDSTVHVAQEPTPEVCPTKGVDNQLEPLHESNQGLSSSDIAIEQSIISDDNIDLANAGDEISSCEQASEPALVDVDAQVPSSPLMSEEIPDAGESMQAWGRVPVRFEEQLPNTKTIPQSGQELAGSSSRRGGFSSVANLVRLSDGRFRDSATGQFFDFKKREGRHELSEPRGIYYDSVDDALYVADSGNGRVQRFRPPGNRFGETVASCRSGGGLDEPVAVALGADGSLFVSDSATDRVLRFPAIAD